MQQQTLEAPAEPMPDTAPPKRTKSLYILVCLYRDDITTVYASHNVDKVHHVRDELRAGYGSIAAFHTVQLGRQSRWNLWEREIKAALAEDPIAGSAALNRPCRTLTEAALDRAFGALETARGTLVRMLAAAAPDSEPESHGAVVEIDRALLDIETLRGGSR